MCTSVWVFSHPGHSKKATGLLYGVRRCLTSVPCHASQGTELKEEPL